MIYILRAFILGFYPFLQVNGFLIDGNHVSTLPPGTCDVERFQVCSSHIKSESFLNITTNGVHIDTEAIYSLYCIENYTQVYIQCIKDHADPRCGPNTDTATILKAVSNGAYGMDSTINSLCRNKTSYTDYMKCQMLVPSLKPYQECVTGIILNTTFEINTCNSFLILGCSYKYIDMVCPDSLKYIIEQVESSTNYANYSNCHLDLPSSATAQSCDLNMHLACDVAFNKPNINDTQAMFQFYCSDRFSGHKRCIRKVANLCKSVTVDLANLQTPLSENQLAAMCSDKSGYEEFQTCFLKYGKNTEFISCLTGNGTLQDSCSLMKTSYTCNKDFIQRTCPTVLPIYQTFSFYDDGNCHVGFMPLLTSVGNRVDMDWTLTITTLSIFGVLCQFA